MSADIRNTFGTVVHSKPPGPIELRNEFATVVHTKPYEPIELRNEFATVVHTTSSVMIDESVNLFLNISEIAWIYQEPPSSGGGGPTLLPAGNGGPMISADYTINSYRALSAERVRRVDQVPFRLARKDRLGVRKIVVTGSTPVAGDDIRIYENISEIAWIYKE